MVNTDVVLYEKRDSIAFLTINRPEALNALNTEVNLKLIQRLDQAEADNEVRVIILKGAGDKAFIAGGDIKEMIHKNAMEARDYALAAKRVIDRIWNLKKPVIAAIQGLCLGGGLEYAMACDLRTASEKARFGQPEINIGIMPGSAGTQRLSRLIGVTKAKQLCFTGDMIEAEEALALGLINEIHPADSLMDKTIELAKKIASKSAPALTLIKSAINRGTGMDLESASLFEIDCFGLCFATEEQKEKMLAFVNKKR
ncbi:MAG TPA: enoyl-CoA hydratase-related protein [Syntrophales bacterium]|jgi:enoyl-CoA hydratase|nr:enoyl-CoA hydratase-related protein [Syntrophales bacterium]HRT61258.1 enoyl-CoA hydratase-related protein [Syntrophales bacterium]